MSSIVKVDTIQENTSANGITVDGLNIKDSKLVTANSVIASNITADAIDATKIADNAISEEHLDVTSITGHTAETSIATDDLILISDTSASGALKKMTQANFVSGVGGTMTPAFFVNKSSVQSISHNTSTQVTYQTEIVDTDNAFASNTFTVPSGKGGKYFLFCQIRFETSTDFSYIISQLKQNSTSLFSAWNRNIDYSSINCSGFADLSAGDTIKHFTTQGSGGALNLGSTDRGAVTYFGGYRIIT